MYHPYLVNLFYIMVMKVINKLFYIYYYNHDVFLVIYKPLNFISLIQNII